MAMTACVEQQQFACIECHKIVMATDLEFSTTAGGFDAVEKTHLKVGFKICLHQRSVFDQIDPVPVLLAMEGNAFTARHFPESPTG